MMRQLTILRGVADRTRLRIIQMLFKGPHCVEEITARLKMSQPRVSRHLRILRESGLVDTRRDRRRIYYSLSAEDPTVSDLLSFLEEWLVGGRETRRPERRTREKPPDEFSDLPAPSVGELEDFLL